MILVTLALVSIKCPQWKSFPGCGRDYAVGSSDDGNCLGRARVEAREQQVLKCPKQRALWLQG